MRILAITNLYPSPDRPWFGTFVEQQVQGLRAAGVEVEVLYFDRKREGPLLYYRMGPRVDEALSRFKPDLVHVMYGGVMADRLTARIRCCPVLVTFHGSDLLGENLSGLGRKLVSRYGVRCSFRAARRASGIVLVARHLDRVLPRNIERGKVRVIPCGIDLSRFRPMSAADCRLRLGWEPGVFHVLFPANGGDPVKRPWLADAAVLELKKSGVNVRLHRLSGVAYDEVPVWINASDVLVLTSLHEGSPTVVKEALACNVAVVSVDVGDVAERIAGLDGCHLAEAHPMDISRKLLKVWNRKGRIDGTRALASFTNQNVVERLKAFYVQLLEASVSPQSIQSSKSLSEKS